MAVVKVKLFSVFSECAHGGREVKVSLSVSKPTVGDVLRALSKESDCLDVVASGESVEVILPRKNARIPATILINGAAGGLDQSVSEEDEIALLPIPSGG